MAGRSHGHRVGRGPWPAGGVADCLAGSVLGIHLAVDESVIERDPPRRKVWETTGVPRLLVVGPYRMGFEITSTDDAARLRVFIDYSLPARSLSRWLGYLFGGYYAKWCTERMVDDAAKSFTHP